MSLPHATEILAGLKAERTRMGHLLVGLDYDGTLAPIVARPEDAHLPVAARVALELLAERPDTVVAILSGRELEDLMERVGVPDLYYAGNHGLEIAGPDVAGTHPGVIAALPALRSANAELRAALGDVAGVLVEDKGASLSVHYRTVPAALQAGVRTQALAIGRGHEGLRCTEGKKVVELRPDVAWHKGTALEFIRATLPHGEAGPVIFVGDDRTDEDAFRSVGPAGFGIVVASEPPPVTAARAWLRSPGEGLAFLFHLAEEDA